MVIRLRRCACQRVIEAEKLGVISFAASPREMAGHPEPRALCRHCGRRHEQQRIDTLAEANHQNPVSGPRRLKRFSVGMVPIKRLQAKGETQFERTLKRRISSAIERDRPTMPIFAAA